MDPFSLPFIAAILHAAYSALMAIVSMLQPVAGPASAAVAIVLITLLVRAALIPVGVSQAKAEQTRARIAPKLQALQKRYKGDRERLQRETVKLYADENASPFAGCLPILIQAPVIGIIYALFLHTTISGDANQLLLQHLFGVPLGASALGLLGSGGMGIAPAAVFLALVAAIVVVAELTRRRFRAVPAPGTPDATARIMGLTGVLNFTTAVIAVFVPLAAGLYLLVTVAWTLAQRVILRRAYPLDASPTSRPAA
jgi:YidC/Oxa1 family membrane protein insertase